MPKITRAPEEVSAVKEHILETALSIMIHDGFENLSMRKLAAKLNMTAANIYNYFSGKDELYLAIQTRGFEILYGDFLSEYEKTGDPVERLKGCVRAYVAFGTRFADYYDIMFNRPTPKFTDYRGTGLEPAAIHEKTTAMQVAHITVKIIEEILRLAPQISTGDPYQLMLEMWCLLHGLVTLYNSRVYQEVDENYEKSIERVIQRITAPFVRGEAVE